MDRTAPTSPVCIVDATDLPRGSVVASHGVVVIDAYGGSAGGFMGEGTFIHFERAPPKGSQIKIERDYPSARPDHKMNRHERRRAKKLGRKCPT